MKEYVHVSIWRSNAAREAYRNWDGLGEEPECSIDDFVSCIPLPVLTKDLSNEPTIFSSTELYDFLEKHHLDNFNKTLLQTERAELRRLKKFVSWWNMENLFHGQNTIAVVWKEE